MSGHRRELKPLQDAQLRASDPQVHATVSASAGSGKTQVLTARVLRLLLQGARPESILCLTFTKAAAAEMANRIGLQLAAWVRMKESELGADLDRIGESTGPEARRRARQLFARVLDCRGGLKIQTIHAFAQSLLAAFPAEAGIAPGFQPIEGRAEQELVRRTLAELLSEAEKGADPLFDDVRALSRRLGEQGAVDYLRACAARGEAMASLGTRSDIERALQQLMNLPEGSVEEHLASRCSDDTFDCDLLRAVAKTNRDWGTKEGLGHLERIERWLSLPSAERAAQLPDLALVVFTKGGEPRKTRPGQVKVDADYQAHADRLAAAVQELVSIQRSAALATDIAAGLRAGQAFAKAYAHAKRVAGVADFNDLIEWTRDLLERPGMGDWVRYKLDRQVDHILVDEAQDTNAAQWEIVRHLVEEYFSGSSETEARWRTLFMVGDFKQAIYGFQGADPNQFNEATRQFKERADDLLANEETIDLAERRAREFRTVSIAASFRSSQAILDTVDAAIAELGHASLALPEAPEPHRAFHRGRAGRAELWRPFSVELADEDSDEGEERWVDLRDRRYAEHLALQVKTMIDEGAVLPSTGRPVAPGDILILVRSRGELASLIVARLFSAGVPVAGVDRLHLHEPLAVQDLLSAVRFAVQPNDDLNLASLLVSPLIGWDQDRLRDLAYGRPGSLWRVLRERSADFPEMHEALSAILAMADYATPSRFLETILSGAMRGRRRLYSRLGPAARDAIEELVNSAIEFERSETPSLDRFLAWFSLGDVDVQRDPGQPANEVRVMTVHGAKGLEAPVVILADATADPARLGRTSLTLDFPIGGVGKAPLLRPKKEERQSPFEELILHEEQRDLEEHWRLLYVALTRAADLLVVSGVRPKAKKDVADPRPANCWHRTVERALVSLGADEPEDGVVQLAYGEIGARTSAIPAPVEHVPAAELPAWARTPAPPEARPPRPLAPSAVAEDREAQAPPTAAQRSAAERGTMIHALMERLPAVDAARRRETALRWLLHSGGLSDKEAREETADCVCSILADPRFSGLFGLNSLAEAPIAATLADGRVIAGTVDRLLVESDRVMVIDYKTGWPPASEDEIPASHKLQMQAYADALSVIFPGRAIAPALLYTRSGRLFELAP